MIRILGTLHEADGEGVVRIEDRYDTGIDDLWSAITDPDRLTRWYGDVDGDLRVGGEFRLHVTSSEWEGTGHIDKCDPPRHLVVTARQSDEAWQDGQSPYSEIIDTTLAVVGDQTLLTIEVRGLPLEKVAYYGAGWQLNVETLGAYLAGSDPAGEERFDELVPSYLEQAAKLG